MRSAMIPYLLRLVGTILVLSPIAGGKAWADSVLLTNLGNTQAGSLGFNSTFIEAVSFSTGAVGATLDSAVADLASNSGTTVFAQIDTDNNNSPGALFASLSSVTFTTSTEELATFDATGTTTLAAGQKYWLVLSTNASGGATGSRPTI